MKELGRGCDAMRCDEMGIFTCDCGCECERDIKVSMEKRLGGARQIGGCLVVLCRAGCGGGKFGRGNAGGVW
jgi:hypothetical protein